MEKLVFKRYQRKGLAEMIPFSEYVGLPMDNISISAPDRELDTATFSQGYVARNPKNHNDLWYVAKKYFDENLEEVKDSFVSKKTNLTFGEALEAVKEGKLISREGWNGKGMFVFIAGGAEYTIPIEQLEFCFLPDNVKEKIKKEDGSIRFKYTEYLCMKAADGNIVNGWLASQTDVLANDWCILD